MICYIWHQAPTSLKRSITIVAIASESGPLSRASRGQCRVSCTGRMGEALHAHSTRWNLSCLQGPDQTALSLQKLPVGLHSLLEGRHIHAKKKKKNQIKIDIIIMNLSKTTSYQRNWNPCMLLMKCKTVWPMWKKYGGSSKN